MIPANQTKNEKATTLDKNDDVLEGGGSLWSTAMDSPLNSRYEFTLQMMQDVIGMLQTMQDVIGMLYMMQDVIWMLQMMQDVIGMLQMMQDVI